MSDKVTIIGYSGHAYVVVDAAIQSSLLVAGYAEASPKQENPFGLSYLGDERTDTFDWHNYLFVIGIGDNRICDKIAERVISNGAELVNVIHLTAWISSIAKIGVGVFIGANVSVNALASVGDRSVLNTGCIVEHECVERFTSHPAQSLLIML